MVQRVARQFFTEHQIGHSDGTGRRVGDDARIRRRAASHHEPRQLDPSPHIGQGTVVRCRQMRLQQRREDRIDLPEAGFGAAAACHLADDRMAGLDQGAGRAVDHLDRPSPFRPGDGLDVAGSGEHIPVEHLGGGNHLDHVAFVGGQNVEARGDEGIQIGAGPQPAAQAPAAVVTHQHLVAERRVDHAAEIERAARREPVQLTDGALIDVTAQDRPHQLTGLLTREGFDVQPQQQLFFPQRGHRVGGGCPTLDGDHQFRRAADCQLLDQQRRQRVEMLRVVDHDE